MLNSINTSNFSQKYYFVYRGGEEFSGLGISPKDKVPIGNCPESTGNVNATTPHLLPGAWISNTKHNKDERVVKHDKTDVPLHFWNNSLPDKLGLEELSPVQQDALNILCTAVVKRVWVRNVIKCFSSYI